MATVVPSQKSEPAPSGGGGFSGAKFSLWIVGGLILAAMLAWAAAIVRAKYAPAIVFPILVGLGLGALLVGLMRLGQIGHRATIVSGTILASIVVVVGQHYAGYYIAYFWRHPDLAQFAVGENAAKIAEILVPTFRDYITQQAERGLVLPGGYIAQGPMAWLAWTADGLLALAAALAIVLPAMWLPFCGRCGTWYRTIQNGRIDAPTLLRIAQAAGIAPAEHPRSCKYRLLSCHGGCGPTGCELSWSDRNGSRAVEQAWLGIDARNRVTSVLDETRAEQSKDEG
jgi:hypothetical protein